MGMKWWGSSKLRSNNSEGDFIIDLSKHTLVLGENAQRELMLMDNYVVHNGTNTGHSISIVDDLKAEYLIARLKEEDNRANIIEVSISDFVDGGGNAGTFDPVGCISHIENLHRLDDESEYGVKACEAYKPLYAALKVYLHEYFSHGEPRVPESGLVPAVSLSSFKDALRLEAIFHWLAKEGNTEAREIVHEAFSKLEGFEVSNSVDDHLLGAWHAFEVDLFYYVPFAVNVMQPYSSMAKLQSAIQSQEGHVIVRVNQRGRSMHSTEALYISYVIDLIRGSIFRMLGTPIDSGDAHLRTERPKAIKPVYINSLAVNHCFSRVRGIYVVLAQGRAVGYAFICHLPTHKHSAWYDCLGEKEKNVLQSLIANTVNTFCLSASQQDVLCKLRGLSALYKKMPDGADECLVHVTIENKVKTIKLI